MFGGKYLMHFVGAHRENGDFEVGFANVSEYLKVESQKQIIDSVRDDIGAVFGSRNFVVAPCTSGAYHGMEYRLEVVHQAMPEGTIGDFRVYVANNCLLEQVAIGASDLVKGPIRDRFFNSLRFEEPPKPKLHSDVSTHK
jgi:hypothetical protein